MNRLEGLDGLRGMAALCVLFLHVTDTLAGRTMSNGYLAVDFFFMLSGYVMTLAYEPRLAAGLSRVSFLARRWRQLWRVVVVPLPLGLPWLLAHHGTAPDVWVAIAANVLLLPFFVATMVFPLNASVWSIFFELVANACHALALRRWPVRRLAWLAGGIAAGAIAFAAWHPFSLATVGCYQSNFLGGLPRALFSYLLGMILARTTRPGALPARWSLPVHAAMPALVLISGLFGPWGIWGDYLVIALIWPPLLLVGAAIRPLPISRWLGAISFPLYAAHAPVMGVLRTFELPVTWAIPISLLLAEAMRRVFAGSRPVAAPVLPPREGLAAA